MHFFDLKLKKGSRKNRQRDLFQVVLSRIIDPGHGLVKLAKVDNWDRLDELFDLTYRPDNGHPGVSSFSMVALHYLKYTSNLSYGGLVESWVENHYWQYFGGMKYFERRMLIDPSSMTCWRKRIGEAGAEELLRETIETGLKDKGGQSFSCCYFFALIEAAKIKQYNVYDTRKI